MGGVQRKILLPFTFRNLPENLDHDSQGRVPEVGGVFSPEEVQGV